MYLKQQDASHSILVGLVEVTGVSMNEELPLDHKPCINHWAILMADEDVARGYHTNWDAAYESAWDEIVLNIKWENRHE